MINITYKQPKTILTKASGYLSGYSHSLNPYGGCAFACSYCYVRQSPIGLFRQQEWGTWVDVKQDVQQKLVKEIRRAKTKGDVTIFMSSSTDPYQPIEYKEQVTRSLLEAMLSEQPDFLFVQTRSPLVTRDIDIFTQLKDKLRVSMTVETDLEEIRKKFSPQAPPLQARTKAVRTLKVNNIPVQIAVAPVLPFSEKFSEKLASLVDRVCIDDFFTGDGSGGKRTNRLGVKNNFDDDQIALWYNESTHAHALNEMLKHFRRDQVLMSHNGFLPY